MSAPIFRCLPEFVSGTPTEREILDFAAVIPRSRRREKLKPNLPILPLFLDGDLRRSRCSLGARLVRARGVERE